MFSLQYAREIVYTLLLERGLPSQRYSTFQKCVFDFCQIFYCNRYIAVTVNDILVGFFFEHSLDQQQWDYATVGWQGVHGCVVFQ